MNQKTNIVEKHFSPDGLLRLIFERDEAGDTTIGFDGYPWHTHGDLIASLAEIPQEAAIRQYLDRILNDEVILVVSRTDGQIRDIWPTDDPKDEFQYKPPEETLEFRTWSGKAVEG